MIVGAHGLVVARGHSQQEIERVQNEYSYLVDCERLILILEDDDDTMLKVTS